MHHFALFSNLLKNFLFNMKINFLFIGLPGLLLSGCSTRQMYSSSAHNVPFLTTKGDSKVAAAYSVNSVSPSGGEDYSVNGYDFQGAYAITDHVALQIGYYGRNEKAIDSTKNYFDESNIRYRRRVFEVGAGYYTPLNEKKKIFLEIFGGAGFGRFSFTDAGIDNNRLSYSRFHNANITKYYLEPSVTFRGKRLATSVMPRFTAIKFSRIKTDYSDPELNKLDIDDLTRTTYVFFEPAVILSYGFKKVPGLRIETQLGFSLRFPERNRFLSYSPVNFSAGLTFDIPKLIKAAVNNPKD